MKLITLRGTNFRQHADTVVEFSNGMLAILGPNGCGKSTLLEMITFALFGEQRAKKDSIAGAWSGSKKFRVVLRFEIDNRIIEVTRTNDSASLEDWTTGTAKSLATSLSEVTTAVEKLLGLTYEQFINSYFCEQKGLAFLDFKNNADRQKEVARMLGFDKLQLAEDIARKRASGAKAKADAIASVLGDLSILRSDLEARELDASLIETEIKANLTATESAESKRETTRSKADAAAQYQAITQQILGLTGRFGALSDAKTTAEAEVVAATNGVARRTAIESDALSLSTAEQSLSALQQAKSQAEEKKRVSDDLAAARNEVSRLDAQLKRIVIPHLGALQEALAAHKLVVSETRKQLDRENDAWRTFQQNARLTLTRVRAELAGIVSNREEAERKIAAGVCAGCGQPVGESEKTILNKLVASEFAKEQEVEKAKADTVVAAPAIIAELTKRLSDSEAEQTSLESQISDAIDTASNYDRVEAQLTLKRSIVSNLEAKLASYPDIEYDAAREATLEAEVSRLRPISREYMSLAGEADRLDRANQALATAAKNMEDAKKENDELRESRSKLGFESLPEADAALKALSDLDIEIARLKTESVGLQRQKTSAENAIATAKQRIDEYRKRETELKTAQAEKLLNETLATEMKSLRIQLNATAGPELAASASEFLSLITNGRYNEIVLDQNFTPTLIDDGVAKTVISGGEEDARDLALRLSLGRYIQERQGRPMSLLILDEVFGSLDVERRQAFMDCLVGLKSIYPQIILISHIEGTAEVADRCLYLARDPETKSTVVGDGPGDFELQEVA